MSLNVFTDYIENCNKEGIEPSWEGLRAYKKVNCKPKRKINPSETYRKIVKGIVENEFNHIQETTEVGFANKDLEYKQDQLMTEIIRKALEKDMTDKQKDLLDEFDSALTNEWVTLCSFYFREGLKAGLTNLRFLNEIGNIEYIL